MRVGRAAIGATCFVACYYGVQALGTGATRINPALPIDWRLPCVPAMAWVYAVGVLWPFTLAFLLPRYLIDRGLAAFVLLSAMAGILFLAFPTDGSALRAQCVAATGGVLGLVERLDPPVNLMPSLHVGYAVLTALWLGHAGSRWRWLAGAMAALQMVAVCLTKQHFVADAAAGALLAMIAYRLAAIGSAGREGISDSQPCRSRKPTMRPAITSSDGSGNVPGIVARTER